jgi:predicted RNA-binding protein YlqC (UPF0109 family)
MYIENLELIEEVIHNFLQDGNSKNLQTPIDDKIVLEEEILITQYVECLLITLNSDEATLLSLDDDEIAMNLKQIAKEIGDHISNIYIMEGAVIASAEFTLAPSIASISKYEALILKVVYESAERICPTQLVDSYISKTPEKLKVRKKSILQKLFRTYQQTLSHDNSYVGQIIKRHGKTIPNHRSLIRSIIPLSFLDHAIYFNETSKTQSAYLPHFYKC